MPEWFKAYLESLPSDLAQQLWDWFDSTPCCEQDSIEVIALELERRKMAGL